MRCCEQISMLQEVLKGVEALALVLEGLVVVVGELGAMVG